MTTQNTPESTKPAPDMAVEAMVEILAREMERHKTACYEWTPEQFTIWWEKDPACRRDELRATARAGLVALAASRAPVAVGVEPIGFDPRALYLIGYNLNRYEWTDKDLDGMARKLIDMSGICTNCHGDGVDGEQDGDRTLSWACTDCNGSGSIVTPSAGAGGSVGAEGDAASGIKPGETVAEATEGWAQWCEARGNSMLAKFLRERATTQAQDAAPVADNLQKLADLNHELGLESVTGNPTAEHWLEKAHVAMSALRELVECKDLKDAIDETDASQFEGADAKQREYNRRKPLAWAAARDVLKGAAGVQGDAARLDGKGSE